MNSTDNPLQKVHLPAAIEPVYLPQCDSALAEAARRAAAGAPEGTLVWAGQQNAARARMGSHWFSPQGGMYCAVILRPELPHARVGEFIPLATVALGAAFAELASAMTDLRYRWPNAVYLGGARAAGSWLATGRDWLVLASAANVLPAEDSRGDFRYANLRTEGGNEAVTVESMLEAYLRHLTSWLLRWDDEGVTPVLRSLRGRADRPGNNMALSLPEGTVTGTFEAIDDGGSLQLATQSGRRSISINNFMALPTN